MKASDEGLWAVDTWGEEWVVCGGTEGVVRVWRLGDL